MDEVALDAAIMPNVDNSFYFQFANLLDEDESWKFIFQPNPDKRKCIERIEGWKYRTFGRIIFTDPVMVNCGVLLEGGVIHTHNLKVIGEYVGFTISRLGGYAV